jgi:hypothetical protein
MMSAGTFFSCASNEYYVIGAEGVDRHVLEDGEMLTYDMILDGIAAQEFEPHGIPGHPALVALVDAEAALPELARPINVWMRNTFGMTIYGTCIVCHEALVD